MQDKFESCRYAEKIIAPTTVVAAENDEVIPRLSTELLFQRFRAGVATYKVVLDTNYNSITESPDYLPLLTGVL